MAGFNFRGRSGSGEETMTRPSGIFERATYLSPVSPQHPGKRVEEHYFKGRKSTLNSGKGYFLKEEQSHSTRFQLFKRNREGKRKWKLRPNPEQVRFCNPPGTRPPVKTHGKISRPPMPAPREPTLLGFLNHEPHHLNQGRMKATQYRRDDWKYEWVGRSFEIAEKQGG